MTRAYCDCAPVVIIMLMDIMPMVLNGMEKKSQDYFHQDLSKSRYREESDDIETHEG
jgi:hypothetical protein